MFFNTARPTEYTGLGNLGFLWVVGGVIVGLPILVVVVSRLFAKNEDVRAGKRNRELRRKYGDLEVARMVVAEQEAANRKLAKNIRTVGVGNAAYSAFNRQYDDAANWSLIATGGQLTADNRPSDQQLERRAHQLADLWRRECPVSGRSPINSQSPNEQDAKDMYLRASAAEREKSLSNVVQCKCSQRVRVPSAASIRKDSSLRCPVCKTEIRIGGRRG